MGRVLAIDVGAKRCGLAVTDPLRLSVNPLGAVSRDDLLEKVTTYLNENEVEVLVLGLSKKINGEDNAIMSSVRKFEKEINIKFPDLKVDYQDEFNSSNEASRMMVEMGIKKKKRRQKENIDILSASIILQRYLGNI